MAQISYEDALANQGNANQNAVSFFSLKHDGDVALVRFMHDSISDFDIKSVHNVTVGGKFRKVNCIRDPREPIEYCPLCNNGTQIDQKFFIHLIQYVRNDAGQLEMIPCVWERSLAYASTLKGYIDDYGPLSDVLFTIRRNGAPGDMKTKYDINYAAPNKYPNEAYPKPDVNPFDDFKVLGTMVIDKNFDELSAFVNTGAFPEVKSDDEVPFTVNINSEELPTIPTPPVNVNPNVVQTNVAYRPTNAQPPVNNFQPNTYNQSVNTRPVRRTY